MSEKTRSIKIKGITDEEIRDHLLNLSAHLNEIKRLEEEKSNINKSYNEQIKYEEREIEKVRVILNDGIVLTVYNFMDKDTHEIVWKDENGNEMERTPFDDEDWKIWEKQYGPNQKNLFDQTTKIPDKNLPIPYKEKIINIDSKDIKSPSDDHNEEEIEAQGEES